LAYVIWVDFEVPDAEREMFLSLVKENAALSVQLEPGCQRFDVLESLDGTSSIALYEIYDSADAFKFHLGTAHFKDFDTRSAPLIARKAVRAFGAKQNAK